jgi:hypothetical protein
VSKSLKRILNLFITLFFSAIVIVSIVSMVFNAKRDLSTLDSFEGKIIAKGLADNPAPNIGVAKVFFIKVEGLDQTLATYNPGQHYTTLDSALNVGDQVKVYYKRIAFPEVPNLNTHQIEKNGNVVFDEGEIENIELKAGILCGIVVALTFSIGYLRDKKIRRAVAAGQK